MKKSSTGQLESPAGVYHHFPGRLFARNLLNGLDGQRHAQDFTHFRFADMQRHRFTLRLNPLTSETPATSQKPLIPFLRPARTHKNLDQMNHLTAGFAGFAAPRLPEMSAPSRTRRTTVWIR